MKLDIFFPATGCQTLIEVEDEHKPHVCYEKRTATEVAADALGEEWEHKRQRTALKKQRTKKNKEKAAEYAQLLTKKMKEAKEKRQEQIAKGHRLSSLRASTSKSESSQK
ncbi:40S ribosomal protein S6 [Tupaia chinensis]|uniref:Small ribosomal subunit protein eS6 n=1 Tax=Tupaia chinensis TaxID=246437 RepID=L9J9Z3_TUPCH|nr:40S ribosomal protein S6 [Tupaia chinensis]